MSAHTTAEVLPTHTARLAATAVRRAAELLRAGEVVALPTETVYGLAANALDAGAVAGIYEAKGRPAENPIIVHVGSIGMARQCVARWPAAAAKLASAFWPGPLTLVLPRSELIPDIVTAGGPTVGVRWPNHPFIQAVIDECAFPLAAPSANLSNRVSPTTAEHVRRQLGGRIPLIVDGGSCQVGIESTVLDLTRTPPRVLRPGMIHAESIAAVIGPVEAGGSDAGAILRSPGQMPKHYAPRARLFVWRWQNDTELEAHTVRGNLNPAAGVVLAHSHVPLGGGWAGVSVIPHDAAAFARALYAELHRCDEAGAEWIAVEAPPETLEWRAISDRLKRAAS